MYIIQQGGDAAVNADGIVKIFVDDTRSRTGTFILFAYTVSEQYEVLYEDKSEEKVRGMFDTILTGMIDGDTVIDIPYQIELSERRELNERE